jgi:DNA-binding NarL/FixJ family response regulator
MNGPIRIVIADDHPLMRQGLRQVIEIEPDLKVVGECEDGADALEAYTRLRRDYVLLDVDMKGVDGVAAARQIIAGHPKARVIIVTDHDDYELRRAAFEAGAMGYVIKEDLTSILEILTG